MEIQTQHHQSHTHRIVVKRVTYTSYKSKYQQISQDQNHTRIFFQVEKLINLRSLEEEVQYGNTGRS